MPFAKADVIIDTVPTTAEIDKALVRLETIARERGTAIGYATALPVTIDRVARWAKAVAGRGIVLVPISRDREQAEIELTLSAVMSASLA